MSPFLFARFLHVRASLVAAITSARSNASAAPQFEVKSAPSYNCDRFSVLIQGRYPLQHVTFHYAANRTPLHGDFSVRIAPGERVWLIGHSDSDKTTFIKLIQRLYDISAARITIDGEDIACAQQASLRSQM
ncbi:hypothetical protein DLM46_18360 [Paraburkholderia lacunae]|uniref:ABC transporter domain-containing protein n=1 Tax=Paraburkholderia lacunae TaxID=2211104 RepID=A0A370N6P0_9BURK|nr:hypothetical protein DLM46_18360 [Paraburkholderia lacunae]